MQFLKYCPQLIGVHEPTVCARKQVPVQMAFCLGLRITLSMPKRVIFPRQFMQAL